MSFFKRMFQAKRPYDPANPEDVQRVNEGLRDWRIFTVDNSEQDIHLVFRVLLEKPSLPPGRHFDTCVTIEWAFEGGGMPGDDVNALQMKFEDALEPLNEANGCSEQVFVRTGRGLKEWCYYTYDRVRFMDEFNKALAGCERFPLTITFYDDPEWQVWHQTRDPLKDRDGPRPPS